MRLSTVLCVLLAVAGLSYRAAADEAAPAAAVVAETTVEGTVAVAEDGAVSITTAKGALAVSGAAKDAVAKLAGKTVKATGVVSKAGIAVSKVEEVAVME